MFCNLKSISFFQLGCGGGLLGIYCLKANQDLQVHFQDFNMHVLKYFTIPNIVINMQNANYQSRCTFLYGDWQLVADNFETSTNKFDLILSSETIYNTANYTKLLDVCHHCLSQDGAAYFAAKSHYFGVGGGTSSFLDFAEESNLFNCEIVEEIEAPLTREILRLTLNSS